MDHNKIQIPFETAFSMLMDLIEDENAVQRVAHQLTTSIINSFDDVQKLRMSIILFFGDYEIFRNYSHVDKLIELFGVAILGDEDAPYNIS